MGSAKFLVVLLTICLAQQFASALSDEQIQGMLRAINSQRLEKLQTNLEARAGASCGPILKDIVNQLTQLAKLQFQEKTIFVPIITDALKCVTGESTAIQTCLQGVVKKYQTDVKTKESDLQQIISKLEADVTKLASCMKA